MKKRWRILALILAVAVLLCACQGQKRELKSGEKTMTESKFKTYLDQSGVSAAVYAVHRGETLFEGGAGEAAKGVANSPDAAYAIASLTKQFTAAAIMQLYEAGKLDLNDKLSLYFPDYAHGDEVTIRHLLSMRSGVPDYEVNNFDGRIIITCEGTDAYAEVFTKNTAEENAGIIRSFFLSRDLLFQPGTRFNYSDSNFALLAEIVSQLSGMRCHDYVRTRFFEPLGMTNASFIDEESQIAATVAESDLSEFGIDYFTVKGAEYGCGDILLTPRDLYRWYRALFGGEIVSDSSLDLMLGNNSEKDELGYGLGLMISDSGKDKVVFHYGWIPSYYTAVFYIPDQDFFLTLLSNRGDGGPHSVAAQMVSYFGKTLDLDLGEL